MYVKGSYLIKAINVDKKLVSEDEQIIDSLDEVKEQISDLARNIN